jgi:hypothetical protein
MIQNTYGRAEADMFAFVMAVIKKTLAGAEEDEVADFKQALARRKESNAQEVSPPAGTEILKNRLPKLIRPHCDCIVERQRLQEVRITRVPWIPDRAR